MKALLSFLTLVIGMTYQVCSQHIQWDNTIGGSSAETAKSAALTSDGGSILGGISQSGISGDKTGHARGSMDYWIVKLDASGTVQWDKTFGGSGADFFKEVIQTADGGYMVAGHSSSPISGDKTIASKGGNDYWILKLDAGGNIQWQRVFGGASNETMGSVVQTNDGGYMIGGSSESLPGGDKTSPNRGGADYWLLKLNASGNIQWQKTIGGNSHDFLNSIVLLADGTYICGGFSSSNAFHDKTENTNGAIDIWVVKIDANANIQWQNTIGGDREDYISWSDIHQTADGGYLLGGSSNSSMSGR